MNAAREENMSPNPHSPLFKMSLLILMPKRLHTLENAFLMVCIKHQFAPNQKE